MPKKRKQNSQNDKKKIRETKKEKTMQQNDLESGDNPEERERTMTKH